MVLMFQAAPNLSIPTVNNTGPGPRQQMGLPPQPSGATPPPTPAQPLTLYQQQGIPGLPSLNRQGSNFLPKPLLPYDPTTANRS